MVYKTRLHIDNCVKSILRAKLLLFFDICKQNRRFLVESRKSKVERPKSPSFMREVLGGGFCYATDTWSIPAEKVTDAIIIKIWSWWFITLFCSPRYSAVRLVLFPGYLLGSCVRMAPGHPAPHFPVSAVFRGLSCSPRPICRFVLFPPPLIVLYPWVSRAGSSFVH